VNQCVGSGSITIGCDPFPATTSGATVTQCNGSANGGTLVELTCTVTGTKASSHNVTINQCNGSANGGGALVICSASISNKRVSGTTAGAGSGSQPTAPATDTLPASGPSTSGSSPVGLTAMLLLAAAVVAVRLSRRATRLR